MTQLHNSRPTPPHIPQTKGVVIGSGDKQVGAVRVGKDSSDVILHIRSVYSEQGRQYYSYLMTTQGKQALLSGQVPILDCSIIRTREEL